MLPDKSHPCWRDLVRGKKTLQTGTLGLQMLLKRCQGKLRPDSPEAEVLAAAGEIHAFFLKYEKILGNEISSL